MVGFINGGNVPALSSCRTAKVVSTVLDCDNQGHVSAIEDCCMVEMVCAYLSIRKFEDQDDVIAIDLLVDYLRSDPAFVIVGLPGPSAHIVHAVSHGRSGSEDNGKK